jgi:hypothetical protein
MIQRTNSLYCPQESCRDATEDIHHFTFTCPSYATARYHLTRKIGRIDFSIPNLLANEKTIPRTLTYLNKTGRLKHIFGDIASD